MSIQTPTNRNGKCLFQMPMYQTEHMFSQQLNAIELINSGSITKSSTDLSLLAALVANGLMGLLGASQ